MYDDQNIFAKILRGEIPCDAVYEDDHALAFRDISPAAPVHVLVIPKGNYVSFDDFARNSADITAFFKAVQHIAENVLNLTDGGYRLITNHGADANQTVPHFHVHILGGAALGGLVAGDELTR